MELGNVVGVLGIVDIQNSVAVEKDAFIHRCKYISFVVYQSAIEGLTG